jgi:hypothetical protein
MAIGATPLNENKDLITWGVCGLLREQAQAADAALAIFYRKAQDLAQANEVQLDKNHKGVTALQSQLEQVLGGLAQLTSTVQWHNSRIDTLDKSANAAALLEAIQLIEMLVTACLDKISGAVTQIGHNVSGAINQIGRKICTLQSNSGPTTHPAPGSGPIGTFRPSACKATMDET